MSTSIIMSKLEFYEKFGLLPIYQSETNCQPKDKKLHR